MFEIRRPDLVVSLPPTLGDLFFNVMTPIGSSRLGVHNVSTFHPHRYLLHSDVWSTNPVPNEPMQCFCGTAEEFGDDAEEIDQYGLCS